MTTVPLLLPLLLALSHSAPYPDDTHLHVHLPPEGGQGDSFLFPSFSSVSLKGESPQTGGESVSLKGKSPKTGGRFVENGQG